MRTEGGTPSWLRSHNDRAALRLLLAHGPLSRSQLGELSGMSKPTAGQMIQRLERVGLIGPDGEVTGQRGPNATRYGVRTDILTGVAISILPDCIEAVLVDPTDADRPMVTLPMAGRERSPAADVSAAVAAACVAADVPSDRVDVVAIGVQAAVDVAADRISFTDTLPGWPETGSVRLVEAATGLRVVVENDVNLATMAERAVGVAVGVNQFAYLWIGAGLGVGIDIGGVVQRGASGGAGEIGYLEVPRSASRIDPDAQDYTDLLGGAAVAELLDDADLAAALPRLAGNPGALASLADRVALVVNTLAAVLDPELVVLGGPTGLAGGAPLADLVAGRLGGRPAVRAGGAGDQPVLLGARRLLVADLRARLEERIRPPLATAEGES